MKVKICGIRSLDAAQAAVNSGADFLGFIFIPNTKRYINSEDAKKIIDTVRNEESTLSHPDEPALKDLNIVGVFRDQPIEEVNQIARKLNLDFVQLHGQETSEYVNQISSKVIKAFNLSSNFNTKKTALKMEQYDADYFMLDRQVVGEGDRLDPSLVNDLVHKFPIFLSGGLTPDNIKQTLEVVQPFAVDVSSGVETNGEKDLVKIKKFISLVKTYE